VKLVSGATGIKRREWVGYVLQFRNCDDNLSRSRGSAMMLVRRLLRNICNSYSRVMHELV